MDGNFYINSEIKDLKNKKSVNQLEFEYENTEKRLLAEKLNKKAFNFKKDENITHGEGYTVLFFEDSNGDLQDICNVPSIAKGMHKISELLMFNGVQNTKLTTDIIDTELTKFTFGSPSASFYIKVYK